MAAFNPQTQDTGAQDFTSASRGTGPNRSLEALFSGVGDAVQGAVQTRDTQIQSNIEQDARYGFDALNQENNLSSDTVPQELTQSQQGLQKLAMAHMQGKVTPEYYYQRLASTLKGLRAKYPGYEKQVDDIVTGVTGTRPANAFRDQLFQNIQQQTAAAQSGANKFETWSHSAENMGYIQVAFPDFYTNPGKYAGQEDQIYSGVAKQKGMEQTFQSQHQLIANSKETATPVLNTRLNQITTTYLEGQQKALGLNGSSMAQTLEGFQKSGGATPEQLAAFNGTYDQFMLKAKSDMIKQTSDPAILAQFSPTELESMRTAALAPLGQIKDMIAQGQYSQAAQLTASITNMQDRAKSALYKADPNMLAAQVMGQISPELGDYFGQEAIKNMGGPADYATKVGVLDQIKGITAGKDTLLDAQNRNINNPGSSKAEKNQTGALMIKGFTDVIKSGKATPEVIKQMITTNYGVGKNDVFSQVDSGSYMGLYNQMFSPDVTSAIKKSGDQEALKAYTDAAVDKFQSIPEFRRAAADLSDSVDYSKYLKASYDPNTNRIVLSANDAAIGQQGYFTRANTRFELETAVKAKDSLNQALGLMAPIIEANGGDETEGVANVLKNLSLNLGGDKKQGFFGWLYPAIDGALGQAKKNLTDTSGGTGDIVQGVLDAGKSVAGSVPSVGDVLQGNVGGFRDNMQEQTNFVSPTETSFRELADKTPGAISNDIKFAIPEGKSYDDLASGKFTGDLTNFQGLTDPLQIAKKFQGLTEEGDANTLASFIRKAGGANIDPRVTPWCAAFVNSVLGASGEKGSGSLAARSFLNWGQAADTPSRGDVVVFERGPQHGHVGFYVGTEVKNGETYIKVLGGNQGNSVKESSYPASRVLGYRRPVKMTGTIPQAE